MTDTQPNTITWIAFVYTYTNTHTHMHVYTSMHAWKCACMHTGTKHYNNHKNSYHLLCITKSLPPLHLCQSLQVALCLEETTHIMIDTQPNTITWTHTHTTTITIELQLYTHTSTTHYNNKYWIAIVYTHTLTTHTNIMIDTLHTTTITTELQLNTHTNIHTYIHTCMMKRKMLKWKEWRTPTHADLSNIIHK